ncbi:MAG TPA: GTPase [Phycisphaerae bacterium]|nr:GTPase [Phycisphaerae bacterium]
MPANLTPEYEKAERRFREARTDEEKLEWLQEMLRVIPKHKGTDHMQADLKRRISQLRKAAAKKTAAKGVDLFHVPRSGAGQVVVVGMPNAGKSSLVAAVTNAPVKVAEYPYTTALPTPGMWEFEDVQIQLVDTPPLSPEAVPPGLIGTIRFGQLVLIVLDAAADPLEQLEGLLEVFESRDLHIRTVPLSQRDPDDARQLCVLLAANKIDQADPATVDTLRELYAGRFEVLPVSCATGEGLERLGRRLWELLDVIRVYTKEPGRPIDTDRPYTLPTGSTLEDLAREIHRDLPEKMKYARIWGPGRRDGQRIHRTEVLHDRDAVEIHQ